MRIRPDRQRAAIRKRQVTQKLAHRPNFGAIAIDDSPRQRLALYCNHFTPRRQQDAALDKVVSNTHPNSNRH